MFKNILICLLFSLIVFLVVNLSQGANKVLVLEVKKSDFELGKWFVTICGDREELKYRVLIKKFSCEGVLEVHVSGKRSEPVYITPGTNVFVSFSEGSDLIQSEIIIL